GVQLKVGGAVGSQPPPEWGQPILLSDFEGASPTTSIMPVVEQGLSFNSVDILGLIPPPTPSVGLYELTGGSITSRSLLIDRTGTFHQSGGSHQERSVQVNADGRYELTGGTLNISSGLNIDGAFDFGHTASTLEAGSAILDLSHGLVNAEHAHIQAGPES